ncbi:MAG: hypothetical protein HS117_24745 [Verrucomicrobiaceae bacterium]|jgi:hypothetical protein|nr:hypothetical protein [Verrucomicrobiaceae bacterium]
MKSFLITILLIGGAFLAYDYFGAPPGQKIVFTDLNPPKNARPATPSEIERDKPAEPAAPMPAPEPPKQVEAPKPAEPAPPPPAPAPEAATANKPKTDSIETLTKNWQDIPPSAFPREVTLLKDAEFRMAAGASKMAAGRKVQALAFASGMLQLAPAPGSTARATVALDDTDLKAVLTDIYEKWKTRRAEDLKRIAAQKALIKPVQTANTNTSEADAGGRPVRAGDGTYPLLLASIRRGQVTDIKPDKIISWGEPQPTTIQGKAGWALKIEYLAMTIFGEQPVEAQALIANGQVQGWFYTGSGEEVP